MPFLENYFKKHVCENVGVFTNDETKNEMIQCTLKVLLDARLFVAPNGIAVGREAYDKRAKPPIFAEQVALLGSELIAMRDLPNGKISGKLDTGQTDDLAMAFMLGIYWSTTIRFLRIAT